MEDVGPFQSLEDVIRDERFADVDTRLRAGVHIDDEDVSAYAFLDDGQPWLSDFYDAYGYELVEAQERYWYLVPNRDVAWAGQLTRAEMVVGTTLALLHLDPTTLRHEGRLPKDQVLETLSRLIEPKALSIFLKGKRRHHNAAVEEEQLRKAVDKALRELKRLGFVELPDSDTVRVRSAIFRFTEPVRDREQRAGLEQLVAHGYVEAEEEPDGDEDDGEATVEEDPEDRDHAGEGS
ncbi:MAG: chromosome partition protein MukE [Myxococcota bacterium]